MVEGGGVRRGGCKPFFLPVLMNAQKANCSGYVEIFFYKYAGVNSYLSKKELLNVCMCKTKLMVELLVKKNFHLLK